jgi:hypothetical protein
MNEKLHARVRHMREQSLIRAWEYRQRTSSKGVWHRFRRVLVDAAEAWIIGEADADSLEARGCIPHPVGRELEPTKRLFFVSPEELERILQRKQVPVRLHGQLLLARSLVLLPHGSPEARG